MGTPIDPEVPYPTAILMPILDLRLDQLNGPPSSGLPGGATGARFTF